MSNNLMVNSGLGIANAPSVMVQRSVGNLTITPDNLISFPNGPFWFCTYKSDGNGHVIPGTICAMLGVVSSEKITILSFAPGYVDVGNDVGDHIVITPTEGWANEAADILDKEAGLLDPANASSATNMAAMLTNAAAPADSSLYPAKQIDSKNIAGLQYRLVGKVVASAPVTSLSVPIDLDFDLADGGKSVLPFRYKAEFLLKNDPNTGQDDKHTTINGDWTQSHFWRGGLWQCPSTDQSSSNYYSDGNPYPPIGEIPMREWWNVGFGIMNLSWGGGPLMTFQFSGASTTSTVAVFMRYHGRYAIQDSVTPLRSIDCSGKMGAGSTILVYKEVYGE